MKFLPTRWFVPSVMGLLCGLLFTCAELPSIPDPPVVDPPKDRCADIKDPAKKCNCLQEGSYIPDEIVLVFEDPLCDRRPEVLDDLIQGGNTVVEICNERVVLMKMTGIDPEAQYQTAKQKMEDEGEGWAGRNFTLALEPSENFSFTSFPPDTIPEYDQNQRPANSVTVAVVDMGVQINHPQFASHLWFNPYEQMPPGTFGIDDPGDGNEFIDDVAGFNFRMNRGDRMGDASGHGTHVSGIIALDKAATATGEDYQNKSMLELMMLTIADQSDGASDLKSAMCAITYAIDNGADIINCSWGYYADEPDAALQGLMEQAKERDIIVVTSAGNAGVNTDSCHHWPSGFSDQKEYNTSVVSVAALDPSLKSLWTTSNNGSNFGVNSVTIAALGQDVNSLIPYPIGSSSPTCALNTGTSMAAPYVSRFLAIQVINGYIDPTVADWMGRLNTESHNLNGLPVGIGQLKDDYLYELKCP
ncbi:MAG: S8 family serine peptidase [Bacteroidota bacterium]